MPHALLSPFDDRRVSADVGEELIGTATEPQRLS